MAENANVRVLFLHALEDGSISIDSYDSEVHGAKLHKFVCYLQDEQWLIVAGDSSDDLATHKDLVWHARNELNGFLVNEFIITSEFGEFPVPQGAGSCRSGRLTAWKSYGFRITTPVEFRELIFEALQVTTRLQW